MSINTLLEDAKNALKEMKRQHGFKKANAARLKAAELQASLAKCRGKLEACKKDFNRTIGIQCRYIQEGRQLGADTTIHEQMLWDAAVGYLLVRDAIFSLRTVSTFDSVNHAYAMLEKAVDVMAGRHKHASKPVVNRSREVFGYVTNDASLEEKQALLDGFFETLKVTGDIEGCLENARTPDQLAGDRRAGILSQPNGAGRWDALDGAAQQPAAAPAAATPGRWDILDAPEGAGNAPAAVMPDLDALAGIQPPEK